jgi:CBS domain-containing protein
MEKVAELMSKTSIYMVSPHESVQEAAKKMKASSKGCLVVVDGGKPVGIVTERDMVHKVVAAGTSGGAEVRTIMSAPLVTIGPHDSIAEAAKRMAKNQIRRLVVTDGGKLVGVLTVTDLAGIVAHAGITEYLRAVIGRGELLETQEALM